LLDSRFGNPGEISFGFGGRFLTFFYERCRGKFSKEVSIALLTGLLKAKVNCRSAIFGNFVLPFP
jgi:hypothetical protein